MVDILPPGLIVEIQTASFAAMGHKLDRLLGHHRMLIVHPIAAVTYLQRARSPARKSPRRETIYALFDELVSIPTLLDHPNLSLEIPLVAVTERQHAHRGRRRYRTYDRELREVLEVRRFDEPLDLLALLPTGLPPRFTTADLARHADLSRDRAQRMAFCLRSLELITELARTRAGVVYRRASRELSRHDPS